jgi:hypothetical protein
MTATLIDSPSATAETRFVEADGIQGPGRRDALLPMGSSSGVPRKDCA